jgi:hypothetical protein
VKIQKVLAGMEGKAIVGTWVRDKTGAIVEFTSGGNFRATWSGGRDEGKWHATSEKEVEVSTKSEATMKFRINEGEKSITRLSDNMVWAKKD